MAADPDPATHRQASPRPAAHSHRRPRRPAAPAPGPARRSPYAQEQTTLLDGARSPLERPYLAAVQRRRRRALWLATVGVDVDHRNIHAGGVR
ncbi:hypothetical protein ABZ958_31440 [Streptomyces sp. NPDC046237]|uniref:hypothetical protein n=1 Tax=Streptomyces sp. NPDC046237 TaxID=3154914 RepID=UPI0034083B68